MEAVRVERMDHLWLIAYMIKDLGLIGMIDARIVPDKQEEIPPGEAVAGMILHGLGFAHRPLSLPPQFFANKPLDLLLRDGVQAEMFNLLGQIPRSLLRLFPGCYCRLHERLSTQTT